MGFVDDGVNKTLLANVHDAQFIPGEQLLIDTFNKAKSGEARLPSEEQFQSITRQLGLEHMDIPVEPQAAQIKVERRSIHLWGRSTLEIDENQLVLVYDDNFLRRGGGSRQGHLACVKGKDAALSHYIRRFNHKKIIIYHKEYSEDSAKFPLFAMKVLTRFCGGHPLQLNAERLILIEKQFALRVFGIGYGCQAPYILSYTSHALAARVENPESLDPYCKRLFLRGKRRLLPAGMLPSPEQRARSRGLHIKEVHSEEEGRASKRINLTGSGSSSPTPNL
ncbi:hypothetical protein L7F22_023982 [Adiantum nelumboides]|nr:hypothetical protein [Adiantum nelumboides]